MSSQPNASEPLWFLDTPEESDSKKDSATLSESRFQGNSELERWPQEHAVSKTDEDDQTHTKQSIPERVNWDNAGSAGNTSSETKNNIDYDFKTSGRILDNPTIENELANIKTDKQPDEIRITLEDEMYPRFNEKNENTEKIIDNTKRPTIYVLLKDKNGSIGKIGNTDLNTETCTEVGSTVINVNDYLSPGNQLTGNESISTAVSIAPSGHTAGDSPQQMELVITIKDERSKTKNETSEFTSSVAQNTVAPKAKEPATRPSVERVIPIKLVESFDANSSNANSTRSKQTSNYTTSSETSWQSSSDARQQGGYSEESDSWVREGDGARCHRTVVTTPHGRTVTTRCYKDAGEGVQVAPPRTQRRQDWSLVNSLLGNLDDELAGVFDQFNRFWF